MSLSCVRALRQPEEFRPGDQRVCSAAHGSQNQCTVVVICMDLLITVASLVVAIFAILPRERRLDLRLRFGSFDVVVGGIAVVLIVYLDLYSLFSAHGLVLKLPRWTLGSTPTQAIHLALLLMLATLGVRSQFARLSRRKMPQFQQLADELLWAESYLELLLLFQAHLERFFRIYRGDFWTQRLRRRSNPGFTLEDLLQATKRAPSSGLHRWLMHAVVPRLLPLLPDHDQQTSIAVETAHNVLLSKGFVAALARSRPYLGIDIIQNLMAIGDGFF